MDQMVVAAEGLEGHDSVPAGALPVSRVGRPHGGEKRAPGGPLSMTRCVCHACGHPLRPPDHVTDVLSKTEMRIFEAVHRSGTAGMLPGDLMERVWDDPGGGPDSGCHALRSHVYRMNKKLRRCGLRVVGDFGRYSKYRIIRGAQS